MDLHLEGRLALVTGSSAGIGKGIAKALLEEGVRVVVNSFSPEEVAVAREELSAFGETYAAVGDLTTAAGSEAVGAAVDAVGDLDILVNNVGVYYQKPFEELTDDDWWTMLNTNVMSAVRMCRHFLPKMLARDCGRVLLLASEAGVKPSTEYVHYCVSKTAVLGLGRALAEATKGTSVTVNSILPGPTWTEGTAAHQTSRAQLQGKTVDQIVDEYFSLTDPTSLLQRFATVEEVAKTCVYYCSDYAVTTNGAPIRAEGGMIRSAL